MADMDIRGGGIETLFHYQRLIIKLFQQFFLADDFHRASFNHFELFVRLHFNHRELLRK
jgi:hypothetical protein